MGGQYGYLWIRASVCSHQKAEHVGLGPRDELKRYLDSPLEEVNDVVGWWGVSRFISFLDMHSNSYIASFFPIPYPFKHGPQLSCYLRVCYTFGATQSIFKRGNHWNCQT
jgi:hypothetical protein